MTSSGYGEAVTHTMLESVRQINLITERRLLHGPIPDGVTVYRQERQTRPYVQWHRLPDPEKTK